MTMKEFLLDQFTYIYDTDGWFVALGNTFKHLTAEQAGWKTEGVENSIWEILHHLNYYNNGYLERFKGNDYVYETSDNKESFTNAETTSDEAWQAEIEQFDSIMSEWQNLLESADDAKFSATNKSIWGGYRPYQHP